MVIFAFLMATTEERWIRNTLWVLFGVYALLDIWRLVSFLAFGDAVLYQDAYVRSDPLIYVPWIMMVLLTFYALLIQKLNRYVVQPV